VTILFVAHKVPKKLLVNETLIVGKGGVKNMERKEA
jgi:hypothetical protein